MPLMVAVGVGLFFAQALGSEQYQYMVASLVLMIFAVVILKVSLAQMITISTIAIFFPILFRFAGKDAIDTGTLIILVSFLAFVMRGLFKGPFPIRKRDFLPVFLGIIAVAAISSMNGGPEMIGKSVRKLAFLMASISLFILVLQVPVGTDRETRQYIERMLELITALVTFQILVGISVGLFPSLGPLYRFFLTRTVEALTWEQASDFSRLNTIIFGTEGVGEIAAVLFPFVLHGIVGKRGKRFLFYAVVLETGLILSVTRSGILLVLLYVPFFTFFYESRHFSRKVLFVSFLSLVICLVVFQFGTYLDALRLRFEASVDAYARTGSLLEMTNRGFILTDAIPYLLSTLSFFGNGLLSPSLFGVFTLHFHNIYLSTIFQYGVVGAPLIFYFWGKMIIRLYRRLVGAKRDRDFHFTMFCTFAIFLVNELKFDYDRNSSYHELCWLLFALLYLSTFRSKRVEEPSSHAEASRKAT